MKGARCDFYLLDILNVKFQDYPWFGVHQFMMATVLGTKLKVQLMLMGVVSLTHLCSKTKPLQNKKIALMTGSEEDNL